MLARNLNEKAGVLTKVKSFSIFLASLLPGRVKKGKKKEPTWITFENTSEMSVVNSLSLCCLYLTNDHAGQKFNYLL